NRTPRAGSAPRSSPRWWTAGSTTSTRRSGGSTASTPQSPTARRSRRRWCRTRTPSRERSATSSPSRPAMGELALVGAGSLGPAGGAAGPVRAGGGRRATLLAPPGPLDRLAGPKRPGPGGGGPPAAPAGPPRAPAGVVGVTGDPADLPRGAGVLFATKGHHLR